MTTSTHTPAIRSLVDLRLVTGLDPISIRHRLARLVAHDEAFVDATDAAIISAFDNDVISLSFTDLPTWARVLLTAPGIHADAATDALTTGQRRYLAEARARARSDRRVSVDSTLWAIISAIYRARTGN